MSMKLYNRLVILVPAVVTSLWLLIWFVQHRADLPQPVAIQFSFDGSPTNYSSPTIVIAMAVALSLGGAAAVALGMISPTGGLTGNRFFLGWLGIGVPAAGLCLLWTVLRVQVGLPDAQRATLSIAQGLVPAGIALLLGTSLGALLSSAGDASQEDTRSGRLIALPSSSRVSWLGSATPSVGLKIAFSLLVTGLMAVAVLNKSVFVAILTLGIAIIALALSWYVVIINQRGITVRGILGFPSISVPLAEITDAVVAPSRPGDWGGWGWRIGSSGTGIITGGPDVLRVHYRDRILEVTCSDPDTAAGVIHNLIGPDLIDPDLIDPTRNGDVP